MEILNHFNITVNQGQSTVCYQRCVGVSGTAGAGGMAAFGAS